MMKNILNNLCYGWSFTRLLRLILGLVLIGEALYNHDWMFGALGGILLVQAFFNVACCTGGACDTNHSSQRQSSSASDIESTTFTEVK